MKKETQLEISEPQKNGVMKQETVNDQPDYLALAITGNLDIDKLERLMAMKERNDKDVAKMRFFEAFTGFQSEMPTITKDKSVSFGAGKTAYNYATLDMIIEAARPILKKYGLSFRYKIDDKEKITVTCFISHVGGHTEETAMSAAADKSGSKNDIQAQGSAVSYMQRYTLMAALGISTGVDTDATALNTDENWMEKIASFKDYDSIANYGNHHALKNDVKFRSAVQARIAEIKGGK